MATLQARLKWTDYKLINPIKCLYKSSMEFSYCDSNTDKIKLYESVRKSRNRFSFLSLTYSITFFLLSFH